MYHVKILKLKHGHRNPGNGSTVMEALIRMNNRRAIIFPCENIT